MQSRTWIGALTAATVIATLRFATLAPAAAPEGKPQDTNGPSFRGPNASGIAEGYPTPLSWNADESDGQKVSNVLRRASTATACAENCRGYLRSSPVMRRVDP